MRLPVSIGLALAAFAGLGANAAHAGTFRAEVARFAEQLPAARGQTFAVVAEDKAMAGGLEFAQYARLVSGKLQALGYVPAADPAQADLVVRFDYGVDKGHDKVRSTGFSDPYWRSSIGWSRYGYWGSPFYGPYRPFGGWGWGFGWNDPWFSEGYESYRVYVSGISLKIEGRGDGKRLFEGRAETASTSNKLTYLVPNLIEAMFTDFSAGNGKTVRVKVREIGKK